MFVVLPCAAAQPVEETIDEVAEGSVPPDAGVIVAESEAGEHPTAPGKYA